MKSRLRIIISFILSILLMSLMCLNVAAKNSGSIKTTNSTGSTVNQNTYNKKTDVYVKGEGIQDGEYNLVVYQNAGATEIGRSVTPITVTNGSFGVINLWNSVYYNSAQGYGNSKNCVYRVELHYASNDKKVASDNFKVDEQTPEEPPVTPEDPPVTPEEPPVTPEEPPVTPEEPPVTPEEPPVTPEDPPVTPEEPPVTPEEPPVTPEEPPVTPEEPPVTPEEPPEEIPDEEVAGGSAIEDDKLNEAPTTLPQTGGIPAEMIMGLGGLITAAGILIKSMFK